MDSQVSSSKWTYNLRDSSSPQPVKMSAGPPGSIQDDYASKKRLNQLEIIEKSNRKKRQSPGMMQPNIDSRPSSGRKNREDARPLVKEGTAKSAPPANFVYDNPGIMTHETSSSKVEVLNVTSDVSKDYSDDSDSDVPTITTTGGSETSINNFNRRNGPSQTVSAATSSSLITDEEDDDVDIESMPIAPQPPRSPNPNTRNSQSTNMSGFNTNQMDSYDENEKGGASGPRMYSPDPGENLEEFV
ncbi:hypothetical protein LOTGIDRAFT_232741, partial [Lottia gigantea]